MALWGKRDRLEDRPKFIKVLEDGTVAQDSSGKKLVFLDNAEAAANSTKGVQGPGWYLISKVGDRTRAELLIALADAPSTANDASNEIEESVELEQPTEE